MWAYAETEVLLYSANTASEFRFTLFVPLVQPPLTWPVFETMWTALSAIGR